MLTQQGAEYPLRRITQDDNDIKSNKTAMHQTIGRDDHSSRMAKKARHA